MDNFWIFSSEVKLIKNFDIRSGTLIDAGNSSGQISMFINATSEEKVVLMNEFGVDEHTIASAMDPDEISRIETYGDDTWIIWKRPLNYSGQDNFYFNVASVGLFLTKSRLAIVITEDISIVTNTRKTTKFNTVMDVLLYYLHENVQHYIDHLKVIKMISRDLQKKINTSMENIHLIQMFNLSESLVHYTNAISSNGVVLNRMRTSAEKQSCPEGICDSLDILIIENNQCYKQSEIYSTVFSGLMDARGTLVNNNMNILLKKLTIINIIFMPLNLIAGIGGMSEFGTLTTGVDWRIAYGALSTAMLILGLILNKILTKWSTRERS